MGVTLLRSITEFYFSLTSRVGSNCKNCWSLLGIPIYIETSDIAGVQYSHREIPISPARLCDTFCCLGDFLSFHRDNRYSQRDAQVTQRDVVTVHRA